MLFTISDVTRFQKNMINDTFSTGKMNFCVEKKTFKECSQKVEDKVYGNSFSLMLPSMPGE